MNTDDRPLSSTMTARRNAGAAIVVTGAAGGIGMAIVNRLHSDGWLVVASDRDETALDAVRSAFVNADRILPIVIDVTRRDSVEEAAASLRQRKVPVTGLINVAGLLQDVQPLLEVTSEQQAAMWDVNYFGALNCMQVFVPQMIEAGVGAIVNITSINEHRPLPLHTYAPTKVALGALTQLAAGEFGPHGVRVNAVAPGFTLTPILQRKIESGARDATVIERHTAMGRLVLPSEIAAVVSFLVGDDASAISGASLTVDAGWMATAHWMNYRELGRPVAPET
jgi:NAD(P)-dependent dehydrogenase (short-subunit alcohol dehydrogenase family)